MNEVYLAKQKKLEASVQKYGVSAKITTEEGNGSKAIYLLFVETSEMPMANPTGAGGSLTQVRQDRRSAMMSGASGFEPKSGCTVTVGKKTYRVLSVEPIQPGEVAIGFTIELVS